MAKQSVKDLRDLGGMHVFVRVDYNVPLEDGRITDDTRIRASLPTLEYLIKGGARLALASHLGRPKKGPTPEFSLAPVAESRSMESRLEEAMGNFVSAKPANISERSEHLAILKRWHYRSTRVGEIFLADRNGQWPMRRIVRGVSRVARGEKPQEETPTFSVSQTSPRPS